MTRRQTIATEYIDQMGLTMRSSRIMVRQGMASGNGGTFANGMPSTVTLGCGTWGGNSISENLNWKNFVNITHVVTTIPEDKPSEEELFGVYWSRRGK
jgi:sulfoacetaldehyde dehydrogenase